MMVLLPYLHMPLHSQENDAVRTPIQLTGHNDCDHHGPTDEAPLEQDTPDSCSLCQLTILPVDLPIVQAISSPALTVVPPPETIISLNEAQRIALHQARAPPYMTV